MGKEKLIRHFNITGFNMLEIGTDQLNSFFVLKVFAKKQFKDAILNSPEIHEYLREYDEKKLNL